MVSGRWLVGRQAVSYAIGRNEPADESTGSEFGLARTVLDRPLSRPPLMEREWELGRASAPAALRFLSEKTLALSGLTLAFVASLLWIIAHDTAVLALALVLAGAGCSTIFPILVAWLTQFTDESASGWRSLAFGAASFGGAVLPKLVGTLSTHFGGLRAGFSLVALAISAMIVLVLFLHRGEAGTAPTAEV